jgi:hypothetical protein
MTSLIKQLLMEAEYDKLEFDALSAIESLTLQLNLIEAQQFDNPLQHLEAKAKCQQGIDTAHNTIKAIDVKRIACGLAPSYSFVYEGASLAQSALLDKESSEPVNAETEDTFDDAGQSLGPTLAPRKRKTVIVEATEDSN